VPVPILLIMAKASGTGKTTIMEKLIAELTLRGFRVGAVKHASRQMDIDRPGKDSWRFTKAGAGAVAVITNNQYALIQKTGERSLLTEITGLFREVDIILVEGFKHEKLPKIEIIRAEMGSEITAPPEEMVAVVTDIKGLESAVPVFALEDTNGLADFVELRFLGKESGPAEEHTTDEESACFNGLTHFDSTGQARMVNVTEKAATHREAQACGEITMARETLALVQAGSMKKGDVLAVARIAAIMGVKETGRLIPMCHPLVIGGVSADFHIDEPNCKIEVRVRVHMTGQTGVEMEALTGVNIALLTIYDMCKAVDKNMVLGNIRLIEKKGGKSGHYLRKGETTWPE